MLKRFLKIFLSSLGALTLLLLILLFIGGRQLADPDTFTGRTAITHSTILTLSLGGKGLRESQSYSWTPDLTFKGQDTLKSIIFRLERAALDPRVKGLFIIIEGNRLGLAQTQEIRAALKDFRSKRKFVYAFADTFGELSNGTLGYYLASAADQVWLQPLGLLGFTGLRLEIPFAKDALKKLDLDPRFEKRGKYKALTESLTETDFSPAYKENIEDVLGNLFQQIVDDVSKDRSLSPKQVEAFMNKGPFLGQEALKSNLIDGVGHIENVKSSIEEKVANPSYMSLKHYAKKARYNAPHRMALVYLDGTIFRTHNPETQELDAFEFHEAQTFKGLRQAEKDPDINAIILRIDSGGGSAIASETLWAEVKRIRESGKPIIVSMGDMAASGGYFIASAANKIVAQRGTFTGSIGVISGKILTQTLWDSLGIHWKHVEKGENMGIWSSLQDYSPHGHERLKAWLDEVYESFKTKVSLGRNLSMDQVEDLAQGRVWTGQEAFKKGLVDELGGLKEAIQLAKKECGLEESNHVKVEEFPRPQSWFQRVMSFMSQDPLYGIHSFVDQARQNVQAFIIQGSLEMPAIRLNPE